MMSQQLWRNKQHVGFEQSSVLSTASQGAEMFSEDFSISQLAVPAVSVLISFLAYTSQYFFLHFAPLPLTKYETWMINIFALCIWISYYRACFVDPGRLPKSEKRPSPKHQEDDGLTGRQRWCRRCEAYKPPRAHHCKTCKRYAEHPHSLKFYADLLSDAFPRWIIIVLGPQTASRISHTRISFAFSFTQLSECHILKAAFGNVAPLCGRTATCPAYVI